jgi:3-hydroxyisobutyrate dehydrogenase
MTDFDGCRTRRPGARRTAVRVAVLGTGTMGIGMAHSLLRAGVEVTAWNRSTARAQPLAADGATVVEDARAAVEGADVVLTMLFDADAVLEVGAQIADVVGDAVWIQSSTIGLGGTAQVAKLAAEHRIRLLDAPVLGTKQPAEQGKLVALASGDPALRELVAPALDAMTAKTVWAGDEIGQGTALKLVCNAWIGSMTAAVAQSLALAGGLGLDPNLFLEAIGGGQSDTPYAHLKGKTMLAGEFPAQFALDGVLKDVTLIRTAVEGAGLDATLITAVQAAYQKASDAGHGGEDIAAVYTAF